MSRIKKGTRVVYMDHLARVIEIRDGRATIIVDGYAASNSVPLSELRRADVRPEPVDYLVNGTAYIYVTLPK